MTKQVLISVSIIAAASAAVISVPRIYPMRLSGLISPIPSYTGKVIAILHLESNIALDGSSYQYAYNTENGISVQESGSLVTAGPQLVLSARGSYQYTSPGVLVQISYTADENGFKPSGNVLLPIHQLSQFHQQY